jgi:flagellar assembly factor FliW
MLFLLFINGYDILITIYMRGQNRMVRIHTRDFGDIEIADEKVISFPNGLPGFPDCTQFALIVDPVQLTEESMVFYWLQSLDDADTAFCLIDLEKVMPEYNPLVDEEEIGILGLDDNTEILIYNMVVIPSDPKEMTVNLKAPIVINSNTRQGMQIICQNDDYEMRYRLMYNK